MRRESCGSLLRTPAPACMASMAWPSDFNGGASGGVGQQLFFTVLTYVLAPHQYYAFHKAYKGTIFVLTKCGTASQCRAGWCGYEHPEQVGNQGVWAQNPASATERVLHLLGMMSSGPFPLQASVVLNWMLIDASIKSENKL